jgi:hypothetical protein
MILSRAGVSSAGRYRLDSTLYTHLDLAQRFCALKAYNITDVAARERAEYLITAFDFILVLPLMVSTGCSSSVE